MRLLPHNNEVLAPARKHKGKKMVNHIFVLETSARAVLFVIAVILGAVFLLLFLLFKYLSRVSEKRDKFRRELDKLAEQLKQARQQAQTEEKDASASDSE